MPHIIIDCSSQLAELVDLDLIVKTVHDSAEASGIFTPGDVKARIITSDHYTVGGSRANYVHVIAHILAGRTDEKKKKLTHSIVDQLCQLLPGVKAISADVRDIRKETFSNRSSVGK
jgi:5-carboxymethyl-2-hydroxymuconate isomerase